MASRRPVRPEIRRRRIAAVVVATAVVGVAAGVSLYALDRQTRPAPVVAPLPAPVRQFRIVFPEGFTSSDNDQAVDQTVLIRPQATPFVTKPGRESWTPDEYVAYSKVCTHAGCPVGLYQEELLQLLCPCHQSLFDVTKGAQPVFGPAPRPLPQLPLYIDDDGFIRAQSGYDQPIGPGFWERNTT